MTAEPMLVADWATAAAALALLLLSLADLFRLGQIRKNHD